MVNGVGVAINSSRADTDNRERERSLEIKRGGEGKGEKSDPSSPCNLVHELRIRIVAAVLGSQAC